MNILRAVILPLIIVGLGATAGFLMREDPGYVLISWGDRAVEMSLWVALTVLVLAWLVLLLARRIWRAMRHLKPDRRAQGVQQLEKGILAFLELKLGRAKRFLARGERNSPLPWVNQLLLARIAQAEKDYPTGAAWLEKATEQHPNMELASGLLLVLSAYESRQLDLALAHAKRLAQTHPDNPFVLRLLRDIYVRLEDWPELLQLQPRLIRAGRRKVEDWQCDMIAGLIEQRPPEAGAQLQKWWKQLTREQQQDRDLRYWYLRAVCELKPASEARVAIEQALRHEWDSRLLSLYSLLETNARERLQQAEKWFADKPHDGEFYLALGRLCLQEQLWGKAQDYFHEGIATDPMPELKLELARLQAALGEQTASRAQLEALTHELLPLPALPLPASDKASETTAA